eukprot:370622-Lingulodinium_polyedra.AAC.1
MGLRATRAGPREPTLAAGGMSNLGRLRPCRDVPRKTPPIQNKTTQTPQWQQKQLNNNTARQTAV